MIDGNEGLNEEEKGELLGDLARDARTVEREGLLDALRAGERDAWHAFAARPTLEARKEHFQVLMALLREVDARAEVLLRGDR